MTKVPKYWNVAKRYLSKKDKVMSRLIKNYQSPNEIILISRRDIFFSLCKNFKFMSPQVIDFSLNKKW